MNSRKFLLIFFCLLSFGFCIQTVNAQGDGPRAWMLGPANMFGIDAKWLNLEQNFVPSGNIFIPNAKLSVNVFPTTILYTFSLGGRYAMLQANITPGKVKGTVDLSQFGLGTQSVSNSGFSDGFFSFRLGLIGAPALSIGQFLMKKPGFSMMGMFRVWYSGTYESSVSLSNLSNLINMGTNRWTFEVGLPMAIPFGGNKKMPFWWETVPSVEFYTTNNDPSITSFGATKTSQQPLINWENHITKNFTPKFWAGIDFRLQYGGSSIVDDSVKSDTKINIFGAGVSAGYQVLPFLGLKGSYGEVIWGYNGADSRMFRLGATFIYVNLKSLKK